jgi:antitoxin ParD1/3/4
MPASLDRVATMNISLPDPLRDFVEQEVRRGGYSSVSEYVRELVRRARDARELDARLMESLESGDLGAITPAFYEKLRQHARSTVPKKKNR